MSVVAKVLWYLVKLIVCVACLPAFIYAGGALGFAASWPIDHGDVGSAFFAAVFVPIGFVIALIAWWLVAYLTLR